MEEMRLVIFGPQGAGKGTQSARISEKYSIPAISTGEIFRWAISHETPLGLEAKTHVEAGKLVPDEVTIGVVKERLDEDDAKEGFLIDGFPRNTAQAKALDEFLEGKGAKLDGAIVIDVPEDVSLRRLTTRRVCSNCGRNYSVDSPPKEDWTCDVCGGRVVVRQDDQDQATIRQRLALYGEQTFPLKKYYESRGVLKEVDGVGSPDEVFDRIVAAL
jgi:adenylate kinase